MRETEISFLGLLLFHKNIRSPTYIMFSVSVALSQRSSLFWNIAEFEEPALAPARRPVLSGWVLMKITDATTKSNKGFEL